MSDRRKTIFCISAAIAVTDLYANRQTASIFRYMIFAVWIGYMIWHFLREAPVMTSRVMRIVKHSVLMVAPLAVMAVYTLVLWAFRTDVEFKNVTRLASTCIYLVLAYGFGCAGYYFFGKKVLEYLLAALGLSYLVGSVLPWLLIAGPVDFASYLVCLLTGADYTGQVRGMEVHDLTFAAGFLFLYYLLYENKQTQNHWMKLGLTGALIFMGLKRIQLLALAVAVCFYFLFAKSRRSVKRNAWILTAGCFAVLYAYLIMIDTGLLGSIAEKAGINTSGRIEMYTYAAQYYEMLPTFIGMGFTKFTRLFWDLAESGANILSFGMPFAIHSNILELFIELGFYGFPLWLFYTVYAKTHLLKKIENDTSASIYMVMTLYMIVLYMTDNTFTYHTSQMMYFVASMVCGLADDLQETTDHMSGCAWIGKMIKSTVSASKSK